MRRNGSVRNVRRSTLFNRIGKHIRRFAEPKSIDAIVELCFLGARFWDVVKKKNLQSFDLFLLNLWIGFRFCCRRDSFITHRAFCDALAEESAKNHTQSKKLYPERKNTEPVQKSHAAVNSPPPPPPPHPPSPPSVTLPPPSLEAEPDKIVSSPVLPSGTFIQTLCLMGKFGKYLDLDFVAQILTRLLPKQEQLWYS